VSQARPSEPKAVRLPLMLLLLVTSVGGSRAAQADALTFGGSLALTSDYIYRGLSQSNGEAALQADLHLADARGTFLGVWGSTRDADLYPWAQYDLEPYLGQRFDLSNSWGLTLQARGHFYLDPGNESADYYEISVALNYLDRWVLSLTVVPDAVQYWYDQRLGRTAAWVPEIAGQYAIVGGLFLTGGAGYYYQTASGSGIHAGNGYGYGNAGLAFDYRRLRIEVSYFLTEAKCDEVAPYPSASHRVAATLSWRF